ncbi:MAG: phenylacetate-CoA oxygenase subunit PaaC, partial [Chryseobacterium sp.]|nr:phenylacetate-CoA oxygenase subunit PaaC [Chryseobacterium sp.]
MKPMNNNYLNYILQLADTSLILGQRLCEWCGKGPVLEQDIAMSNIALDLLGESSNYYQYAAEIQNEGKTEDDLAFLRNEREFKNLLLVERENGHFGDTIVRQFFFDAYHHLLLSELKNHPDLKLSSIAEKSLKEVTYHLKWSSEWMIRLGDGTEESHNKIQKSVNDLVDFTDEMFIPTKWELGLIEQNIIPDIITFRTKWETKVLEILNEATLFVDFSK